MTFPTDITAGDSLAWTFARGSYPPGDGWTCTTRILNGTASYEITGVPSGTVFDFVVTPSETALWAPGSYNAWEIYTLAPDERDSFPLPDVSIVPDPTAGPTDGRSFAQRMLDSIDAILEGRATNDDLDLVRTQARTRSAEIDPALLQNMRIYWQNQIASEKQIERIKAGKGAGNKIVIQFSR